MYIDMSTKELRAASSAFAVAQEVARERLGQGAYVDPGMLLIGLEEHQLREFILLCRELERSVEDLIPSQEIERGEILISDRNLPPPIERMLRETRRKTAS